MKAIKLSSGAYFDDDELLHDENGNLMPDGVYDIEGVGIVLYEGESANEFEELMKSLGC